eukprot:4493647-Pyramimonas_sp.AAC.2
MEYRDCVCGNHTPCGSGGVCPCSGHVPSLTLTELSYLFSTVILVSCYIVNQILSMGGQRVRFLLAIAMSKF